MCVWQEAQRERLVCPRKDGCSCWASHCWKCPQAPPILYTHTPHTQSTCMLTRQQVLASGQEQAKTLYSSYARVDILRPYFDVEPADIRNRLVVEFHMDMLKLNIPTLAACSSRSGQDSGPTHRYRSVSTQLKAITTRPIYDVTVHQYCMRRKSIG